MKIGIITNLYPPYARGGAEFVIMRTVGELLSFGHDVFIITTHPRSHGTDVVKDDTSDGERIYRFYPKNVYHTLDDYRFPRGIRALWHLVDMFSASPAKKVADILALEQPDVVITHNLKGIGLSIPRQIQAMGFPHVHVAHDLQLIVPSGLLMFGYEKPWPVLRPLYWMYQRVCAWKVGKPEAIVFPSRYLEEQYRRAGFFNEGRIQVLQNPAPRPSGVAAHTNVGGPLKIVFAGQLVEHKGIMFLLNVLKSSDLDYHVYIAGGGPLKERIQKIAAGDKRITYLGFMPNEEILNVFRVSDGVIVPSLCYENAPSVIYEALQTGVPVVASRIGGVGELVEEGKNGYLFTPGDAKDCLRALQALSASRDRFSAERAEIRETVSAYALDKYVTRLEHVLTDAVQRRAHERREQV